MIRFLLLFLCFVNFCYAKQAIRLDFDITELAEKERQEYGIEKSTLVKAVTKQLQEANITVKNDPNLPELLIRINSIPTEANIATCIDVGFFEYAELVPKKQTVLALTWSQRSMIIGSKETYETNISQEVAKNVTSFIETHR